MGPMGWRLGVGFLQQMLLGLGLGRGEKAVRRGRGEMGLVGFEGVDGEEEEVLLLGS